MQSIVSVSVIAYMTNLVKTPYSTKVKHLTVGDAVAMDCLGPRSNDAILPRFIIIVYGVN